MLIKWWMNWDDKYNVIHFEEIEKGILVQKLNEAHNVFMSCPNIGLYIILSCAIGSPMI